MRVRVVRSLTCSCAEEDHHNGEEVAQVHGATRRPKLWVVQRNDFRACPSSLLRLYCKQQQQQLYSRHLALLRIPLC